MTQILHFETRHISFSRPMDGASSLAWNPKNLTDARLMRRELNNGEDGVLIIDTGDWMVTLKRMPYGPIDLMIMYAGLDSTITHISDLQQKYPYVWTRFGAIATEIAMLIEKEYGVIMGVYDIESSHGIQYFHDSMKVSTDYESTTLPYDVVPE